MYSLFIDTTKDYCHLAILQNDKIINNVSIKTHNNLTDIVVEHIDSLIKQTKISKIQIKKVLLIIGPGSFTGVRVTTLIAKSWFITNKAKIYIMDGLWFQLNTNSGISLLDAKGNQYYLCVYKNNKKQVQPKMIKANELNNFSMKYRDLRVFKNYENINIKNNILFHLKHFKLVKSIDKLTPLYIKPPL